jgi:hypothetical protein
VLEERGAVRVSQGQVLPRRLSIFLFLPSSSLALCYSSYSLLSVPLFSLLSSIYSPLPTPPSLRPLAVRLPPSANHLFPDLPPSACQHIDLSPLVHGSLGPALTPFVWFSSSSRVYVTGFG